jgi:NAD(P)H-dependent FMN reductase
MSETVWIVLMICVTVVLVAVFALPQLRDVLKVFKMMVNKKGINATIETKPDSDVTTGLKLTYRKKSIENLLEELGKLVRIYGERAEFAQMQTRLMQALHQNWSQNS